MVLSASSPYASLTSFCGRDPCHYDVTHGRSAGRWQRSAPIRFVSAIWLFYCQPGWRHGKAFTAAGASLSRGACGSTAGITHGCCTGLEKGKKRPSRRAGFVGTPRHGQQLHRQSLIYRRRHVADPPVQAGAAGRSMRRRRQGPSSTASSFSIWRMLRVDLEGIKAARSALFTAQPRGSGASADRNPVRRWRDGESVRSI